MSFSKIGNVIAQSAQVIIISVFVIGLFVWFWLSGDDFEEDWSEAHSGDNSTIC
jgi:hypothetical protein